MNWLEPHHLYWGIIAVLLGLWWICDDLYQHIRQRWEPGYTSPWHRWYIAFLKWVKGWFK